MEAARLPDRSTVPAVNHLRPVPDPKPPAAPIEGEPASIEELERWATVLRIDCVRMLAVAKSGHLDSSLSSADILTALYHRVLKHDPKNPTNGRRATASSSPRDTRPRSSTRRSPATATSRSRT